MFTQKKLLREIYNAQPVKGTKKKKPKHDSNKQGTKHYATPPLAAEPDGGQQGQLKKETTPEGYTRAATTDGMSEPRARAARQKGQLNFGNELRHMLHAYGDPTPPSGFSQEPLPETVRVLDEIVTDFIIDSCHSAAAVATHAGRQKVKADDFHFMLRHDPVKLGRVQELIRMEKELKEARKVFDQNDDKVGGLKEAGKSILGDGEDAGDGKEGGKKKKGKKAKTVVSDAAEGSSGKKRKRKE